MKLKHKGIWFSVILLLCLLGLFLSKKHIDQVYRNLQVSQTEVSQTAYSKISQNLAVKSGQGKTEGGNYLATIYVKAKTGQKLSRNDFYLYQGLKEGTTMIDSLKINGQASSHLRSGINKVQVKASKNGNEQYLYLLVNQKKGKYVKYHFNLQK